MQNEVTGDKALQVKLTCFWADPLEAKVKSINISIFVLTVILIKVICTRLASFLLVFTATTRLKDIMQWIHLQELIVNNTQLQTFLRSVPLLGLLPHLRLWLLVPSGSLERVKIWRNHWQVKQENSLNGLRCPKLRVYKLRFYTAYSSCHIYTLFMHPNFIEKGPLLMILVIHINHTTM